MMCTSLVYPWLAVQMGPVNLNVTQNNSIDTALVALLKLLHRNTESEDAFFYIYICFLHNAMLPIFIALSNIRCQNWLFS